MAARSFATWERELADGTRQPLPPDAQRSVEAAYSARRRYRSSGVGAAPPGSVVETGDGGVVDADDMLHLSDGAAPVHRSVNAAALSEAIRAVANAKTWAVEAVPVRYLMPQAGELPPRGYFAFKVTTINGIWCTDLLCRLPQLLSALPSYGRRWAPAQIQTLPRHPETGRPLGLHVQATRPEARRLGAGAPASDAGDRLPFSDARLGNARCAFRLDLSNGPSVVRSGPYEYLVATGACADEWASPDTSWHLVLATSGGEFNQDE